MRTVDVLRWIKKRENTFCAVTVSQQCYELNSDGLIMYRAVSQYLYLMHPQVNNVNEARGPAMLVNNFSTSVEKGSYLKSPVMVHSAASVCVWCEAVQR